MSQIDETPMRTTFTHTRMTIQGVPSDQIKTININR
jgi:hypothetical protein